MRAGTLPWLLHHEWRLWCRDPHGLPTLVRILKICFWVLLIGGIGLSTVGFFTDDFRYPPQFMQQLEQNPDADLWTAIWIWSLVFFVSLSKSLDYLSAIIQSPGISPLVSSPLTPQHLFLMKFGKVIAITLFETAPFIVGMVIVKPTLHFLLGAVFTGVLLAVLSTSLVMWSALGLGLWLGTRWGSLALKMSLVLFWLILYCFLCGALEPNADTWETQALWQLWQQHDGEQLWWGRESWLWLPARTLFLEPCSIVVMTLLSVGLTWISCQRLPTVFMDVIQQPQVKKKRSLPRRQRVFVSGVIYSVILKEWRILLRSERFWIIAVCLNVAVIAGMLVLPYLPAFAITPHIPALAGLYALWMGMTSSGLFTRFCFIQRQDLNWLGSAPANRLKLRLSKLLATLLMIWCVLFPVVGAITLSSGPGMLMALLLLPMTISQAVLSMWHVCFLKLPHQTPSPLDPSERNNLLMYLESANVLSWLSISILIYFQYWLYCLIAVILAIGIMIWAFRHSHQVECSFVPQQVS